MSSVIEKDIALADLADALDIAKRAEDDAKLHRLKVEERILDLVGAKREGATKFEAPGWVVTTTGKVTRSLDSKALDEVLPLLPEGQKAVVMKPQLSIAGYRALGDLEPEAQRILDRAITSKPAKTTVNVKRVD